MKKLLTTWFLLLLITVSFAQNIPDNRKVDWSICGHEGEIPCQSTLRNVVSEFGIDNTGASDVTSAVNTALMSIGNDEVLYFPDGVYLFNGTVEMPSHRVLRGESVENTVFRFDHSGTDTGIEIFGNGRGSEVAVTAIGAFGEYTVSVADASAFSVGDEVELQQENDPALHGVEDMGDLRTWAENLKGQLAQISAINGNEITLDRSLGFSYDINFTTTLAKVDLVEEVGLENFKLIRVSDNGVGFGNNNMRYSYAKNCWMRRIHLEYSSRYHVQIDHSRNIEGSELFMDKAYSCGSGGAGYGLLLQDHVSECLFENNIAEALRHPWIVKEGVTRNVFAYNYSSGTTQGDACNADPLTDSYADISIHGHYPAYNLFESNIVYRITSSDAYGPNGPGNTFFRNRVLGAKGIWIQSYSLDQNVIANELTYPNAEFAMDRDGTIGGSTLNWDNYDGNGILDSNSPVTIKNSLYLTSKPAFFGANAWPSIGGSVPFNTGTIPAKERYLSGNYFNSTPLCSACEVPNLGPDQSICGKSSLTLDSKLNQAGRTFQWYKGSTLLSQSSNMLSVAEGGTYRVVSDENGCVNQDEIIITATLPSIDLGASKEICLTSSIVLESNIIDPGYSYQWFKDGALLADENGPELETSNAGEYLLVVGTSGCDDVEGSVSVSSSLLSVQGDTLCSPGNAALQVLEGGNYNWFLDEEGGSAFESGSSIVVSAAMSETYYVEDAVGYTGTVGHPAPDFTNSRAWDDNRFERKLTFEVYEGLSLDSISFYPSTATSVVVRVLASDNSTEVETKTFNSVVADQENRVSLGFKLDPGTYFLDFEGTNGDLYYSNENDLIIAYPYTLPGVISVAGADPSWITNKPYYMFAYNWRVSVGNSCTRTPVEVIVDAAANKCLITGSNDLLDEQTIYPNPAKDRVILPQGGAYEVLNTKGNVLMSGSGRDIDLSSYAKDVYYIRINGAVERVVKQ